MTREPLRVADDGPALAAPAQRRTDDVGIFAACRHAAPWNQSPAAQRQRIRSVGIEVFSTRRADPIRDASGFMGEQCYWRLALLA